MSVRQGDQVSRLITEGRRPWNRLFNGRPVAVPDQGPLPRITLPGGATATLLSPTMEQLRRLRFRWQKDLRASGLLPESEQMAAETAIEEETAIAEEAASPPDQPERNLPPRDSGALRDDMDLEALANAPFSDDMGVPNGSSIAVLIEIANRSLLIGGDAFSRVLEGSISRLLQERGQTRLHLDLFVVPHGGSRSSLSRELLERLGCDRYVMATSGQLYGHPSREAVARIIVYGRDSPNVRQTLIFNYRSEVNQVWASPVLQRRYNFQAIYPDNEPGIRVTL